MDTVLRGGDGTPLPLTTSAHHLAPGLACVTGDPDVTQEDHSCKVHPITARGDCLPVFALASRSNRLPRLPTTDRCVDVAWTQKQLKRHYQVQQSVDKVLQQTVDKVLQQTADGVMRRPQRQTRINWCRIMRELVLHRQQNNQPEILYANCWGVTSKLDGPVKEVSV